MSSARNGGGARSRESRLELLPQSLALPAAALEAGGLLGVPHDRGVTSGPAAALAVQVPCGQRPPERAVVADNGRSAGLAGRRPNDTPDRDCDSRPSADAAPERFDCPGQLRQ